jgi:hypothetical protein
MMVAYFLLSFLAKFLTKVGLREKAVNCFGKGDGMRSTDSAFERADAETREFVADLVDSKAHEDAALNCDDLRRF